LVGERTLELAAVLDEQLAEPLRGERRVERVRTEPGDARHVGDRADQVHREPLLGALLGEVEPAAVVEVQPRGHRSAARQRWVTRCSASGAPGAEPPISMSRNFPYRPEPVISSPAIAVGGGSKVFSALIAGVSSRATTWPAAR